MLTVLSQSSGINGKYILSCTFYIFENVLHCLKINLYLEQRIFFKLNLPNTCTTILSSRMLGYIGDRQPPAKMVSRVNVSRQLRRHTSDCHLYSDI